MESKTLGTLEFDSERECRKSKPIKVAALGNVECVFTFPDLDAEAETVPNEFEDAVHNFMSLSNGWLECCSKYLWEYFHDVADAIGEETVDLVADDTSMLTRIEIDSDIEVTWDYDANDVYVSLGGGCDWEIEHGLQITIRNGMHLAKVGDCNGHVTNADAYDRDDFKEVIYVKRSML